MAGPKILVVRIGSMGDVIHALPAVATLKHSFAGSNVAWCIDPRWAPLLEGNPFVDRIILLQRRAVNGLIETWRGLRSTRFDLAVDFQGLIQSALIASLGRADRIFGFHQNEVREKPAALFYSNKVRTHSAHIVDKYIELAAATGASGILRAFPIPPGLPEGELPDEPFVLASPLAGWRGKQWPPEYYGILAQLLRKELGMALVLNGPLGALGELPDAPGTIRHLSGLPGLIHATRQATAVVGLDSGPLHLAAALGKPGVAIFGPTDPARNGPYGNTFTVLRSDDVITSYKRRPELEVCMRAISPESVVSALAQRIRLHHSATQIS